MANTFDEYLVTTCKLGKVKLIPGIIYNVMEYFHMF